MYKKLKIIFFIIVFLIIILFILSLIPYPRSSGAILEEDSDFDLKSCTNLNAKLSNWNNQLFCTTNEPEHKYLDELKRKFIESGISEEYFNKNIKLIYADAKEGEINAWFKINTNSWLDRYNTHSGEFFPICGNAIEEKAANSQKNGREYDICKYYVTRVRGWINLGYEVNEGVPPIVYLIQGKVWHDDKLIEDEHAVPFIEIKNILSPLKAGLISKTCVPISLNLYDVFLSPKMRFEYVVNGENIRTLLNPMEHMQARIDLATGEIECISQDSIIFE